MAITAPIAEDTVLVLGAGASLADAISHHPKRDKLHPPLDRNFFARAARRIQSERGAPTRAGLLAKVVNRAERLGQQDLCGSNPPVSLEEHLGRLYFDLTTGANQPHIEAYYDLVRLYNSELLMTTNWMVGRRGAINRLIQREHRTAASLAIITFNHDLLIENALATLPATRHAGAWCLRHAYGLPPNIETISDPSETYDPACPGNRHRHVPIFKMHGSCNWIYRTVNAYPSAQVARGNRKLVLWHNTQLSQSTTMLHRGSGRHSWHIWPLIVPPVYEKHRYITGELKRVWDDASDALQKATRVIFWGYSFPRADLHARYFFSAAAHYNEALRAPILINPDPGAEDELWNVLRPRQVIHYRDVEAFLADGIAI